MTLLAVERMKLLTTRSPWWCALLALVLTIGFSALMAGTSDAADPMNISATQFGYGFGLVVIMVMAALAVTTEYRFSTIRATFLAVPRRPSPLVAKATVVALLAGVVGEAAAFGSWGIAKLIKPTSDLAINSSYDWRAIAGVGLVYAVAAVIAVAVGLMLRHSAGAIAVLMIWTQLAEPLVQLIPKVGDKIHKWLPFNVANKFITGNPDPSARDVLHGPPPSDAVLAPWPAIAAFAAFAVVLFAVAVTVANRRDA
ncbi:ABC transporter permease [Actinokineospora inagensis]|uniref:ABC transporter permease n=1 Tax=Actinokineospora inagensis TaxID=103730 RepID=UPI0004120394|nr:ABC transporter permease [Actinokineospora inagensis]